MPIPTNAREGGRVAPSKRTFRMALSVSMINRVLLVLLLASALVASPVRGETATVQTAWRLLDYLAVDYRGAVQDGEVISPTEYAEMTEFAATAHAMIAALPASDAKADLQRRAAGLLRRGQSRRRRARWRLISSSPIQ